MDRLRGTCDLLTYYLSTSLPTVVPTGGPTCLCPGLSTRLPSYHLPRTCPSVCLRPFTAGRAEEGGGGAPDSRNSRRGIVSHPENDLT